MKPALFTSTSSASPGTGASTGGAASRRRSGAMPSEQAARIGREVGRWPLFSDAAEGLRRLQAIAPICATTNSDREHGRQVQERLGCSFDGWISADEVRSYKPALAHWEEASRRMGVAFGPSWWHVSAYGDYDLSVARRLGLTCVYVPRPHHRPGPYDVSARDLVELARLAA